MGYETSDSSGTDDDPPSMIHNRGARGQPTGNGASGLCGLPYINVNDDMERHIYMLEQEAYRSVLRAFKAQSDALTWEKESLITDLRKELGVSDKEHRELLASVNADDVILRIREWRQSGGVGSGLPNNTQAVLKKVSSPTVSVTHKKQKLSQSLPIGGAPALNTQVCAAPLQPSSSAMKRGAPPPGAREKKPKLGQNLPRVSSMKSVQYPMTGHSELGHITNRGPSGALAKTEPTKDAGFDLVGRAIMTRWPEDNTFYKAVISEYDPVKGMHSLAYDVGTDQETYEWVNLKEISPDDIRWDGEDPGTSFLTSHGGSGRGSKMPYRQGGVIPDIGKGRGTMKNQSKKDFPQAKKTIPKKSYDDIRILDTDALIKQVVRVFSSNNPDPIEVDKAKELLKVQEQSLVDALNKLADASDDESEKSEYKVSPGYTHGIDQETRRKKRPHPRNQNESRW